MVRTYATLVEVVLGKSFLQDSFEFLPAEFVDRIELLLKHFFAWILRLSRFDHTFEAHGSPLWWSRASGSARSGDGLIGFDFRTHDVGKVRPSVQGTWSVFLQSSNPESKR
jgi:hypothetical protein